MMKNMNQNNFCWNSCEALGMIYMIKNAFNLFPLFG